MARLSRVSALRAGGVGVLRVGLLTDGLRARDEAKEEEVRDPETAERAVAPFAIEFEDPFASGEEVRRGGRGGGAVVAIMSDGESKDKKNRTKLSQSGT